MVERRIAQMEQEFRNCTPGYVQRIEEILAQIIAENDPACIGVLLTLFDDNAEYDEMMFSIVHAIEHFDDITYVRSIVDHLDTFFDKSPRWAVIVHVRILNSPSTLVAYGEYISQMSIPRRAVIHKVLEAVKRRNAKFESPCNSLLARL